MEAIAVMPNEIEALSGAVSEMRLHFDQLIHETIIPRMDRVESKVDDQREQSSRIEKQVIATNGRVRAIELWQARWEGMKAGAGGSWHVLVAGGGLVVGAVGLIVAVSQ